MGRTKADSLYGTVECDRSGQSCTFQNLVIREEGEYRVYLKRKGYSRYAGIILSEGIGSPSRYYYIDSWSMWGEEPSRVELAAQKEIDSMDPRPLPIFLSPLKQGDAKGIARLDGLTVHISILWPENFFRAFYGFAAAWSTLSRWDLTVMRSVRFHLADKPFTGPALDLITRAFRVEFMANTSAVCYERAVVGISRHAWLDETAFRVDSTGLALRTKGFQDFATRLKSTLSVPRIPANAPPLILFVGRKGSRRVPNMSEVMHETLMRFGSKVRVKLVYLELLPLPEQIELVQQARVVVAVHGAALTHILFMRKGSFVVEIFPFGFKKAIYRDLARCSAVNYLSYQVPRPEAVRFLKRDDEAAMEMALERGEPDWGCYQADPTCRGQKEWWRAQDFSVDPTAFLAHLAPIFPLDKPAYTQDRYLLFMPWEQFGNQMVEFKSACALAISLNRTLVLPPVGFWDSRKAEGLDPQRRRWYNPRHYNWRPFDRYFEGTEQLPCSAVPWDAFTGLLSHLDALMYRATDETDPQKCRQRTEWFYYEEAAMKWTAPPQIFYALQVKPEDLATRRAMQKPRVLALGNTFMMAQLGPWIRFPVTRYTDLYAGSPLYAQMVLPYRKELGHLVWTLLHCSKSPLSPSFDAAHIRRGDYRDKCIDDAKAGNIKSLRQLVSCWQPDAYLERRLASTRRPLYIATNGPPDSIKISRPRIFLRDLKPALRASKPSANLSKEDLARAWETLRWADPIELAIIDQLICAAAVKFTGNLYSSFTRAIIDQVHRSSGSTRHAFF
jgi:hypothetical protein